MKTWKWVAVVGLAWALAGCKKSEEDASVAKDPAARAANSAAVAEAKASLANSAKEISAKNYDGAVGDILKVLTSPGLNDETARGAYEMQSKLAEAAKTDPAAAVALQNMRNMRKGR